MPVFSHQGTAAAFDSLYHDVSALIEVAWGRWVWREIHGPVGWRDVVRILSGLGLVNPRQGQSRTRLAG